MSPVRHQPFVSVIIPAYNRGVHLRDCLSSFQTQDYPKYEVILVDNASTDDTAEICEEYPNVRYVLFDRCKSSYGARNAGVSYARGDILAFFDADQSAKPNYLSLLLEEYVSDDANHIYVARLEDDPRMPRVLREHFPWSNNTGNQLAGEIQTAAVAVPRELFDTLGGFKEHLLSGGDFEFFKRAVQIAEVHQNREVGAYHYYATSVGHYLLKEERGIFGRCLLAEYHRESSLTVQHFFLEAFAGCAKRAVDAISIPLRYPAAQWPLRWHANAIACLKLVYRLKAVLKYNLGCDQAGDLPRDARTSIRSMSVETTWQSDQSRISTPLQT